MSNNLNTPPAPKRFSPTDHLANERTFLAWIRTNLGIMAFGFVVEKFSFFIRQIGLFLGKSGLGQSSTIDKNLEGFSSLFGISLVGIGAILCIFAFLKFKKTERAINEGAYQSANALNTFLALFVFFIGIFLIIYLIQSRAAVTN